MRPDIHHHRCVTCRQEYQCGGVLWWNHDGFPEVYCTAYDERQDRECAECEDAPFCSWCGAKHVPLEKDSAGDLLCFPCQQDVIRRDHVSEARER